MSTVARAEYIVFRIDYRGNDRSEGVATGAYGDPSYTVDVLNAVTSLQHIRSVNSQKIGMWGHSWWFFNAAGDGHLEGYQSGRNLVGSGWLLSGYAVQLASKRTNTNPATGMGRSWRVEWIEQYGTPEKTRILSSISANSFLTGPLRSAPSSTSQLDGEVRWNFR